MEHILLVFYLSYKGVATVREKVYHSNTACVDAARVLKSRVKVGRVAVFCNLRRI
jgi:hypothetical protein